MYDRSKPWLYSASRLSNLEMNNKKSVGDLGQPCLNPFWSSIGRVLAPSQFITAQLSVYTALRYVEQAPSYCSLLQFCPSTSCSMDSYAWAMSRKAITISLPSSLPISIMRHKKKVVLHAIAKPQTILEFSKDISLTPQVHDQIDCIKLMSLLLASNSQAGLCQRPSAAQVWSLIISSFAV